MGIKYFNEDIFRTFNVYSSCRLHNNPNVKDYCGLQPLKVRPTACLMLGTDQLASSKAQYVRVPLRDSTVIKAPGSHRATSLMLITDIFHTEERTPTSPTHVPTSFRYPLSPVLREQSQPRSIFASLMRRYSNSTLSPQALSPIFHRPK